MLEDAEIALGSGDFGFFTFFFTRRIESREKETPSEESVSDDELSFCMISNFAVERTGRVLFSAVNRLQHQPQASFYILNSNTGLRLGRLYHGKIHQSLAYCFPGMIWPFSLSLMAVNPPATHFTTLSGNARCIMPAHLGLRTWLSMQ